LVILLVILLVIPLAILLVIGLLIQLSVVQTYLSGNDFYSSSDNPLNLPELRPGKPEMHYTTWTKQVLCSLRISCFSWKTLRDIPVTPVLNQYQQLTHAQDHIS